MRLADGLVGDVKRPIDDGEAFRQLAGQAGEHAVAGARRAIAHATNGHCLQQNLFWVLGTERRWT